MKLRWNKRGPTRPGCLATRKETFGPWGRYAIAGVYCRFFDRHGREGEGCSVQYFVWDAETTDPVTGGPEVIRQAATIEDAMRGLETEDASLLDIEGYWELAADDARDNA